MTRTRRFFVNGLTLLALAGATLSERPGWWPVYGVLAIIAVASLAFAWWDGVVRQIDSRDPGS